MSTKKVKDGIAKQSVSTKPKKTTETAKKDATKVRISSRTESKKKDDDQDKPKKIQIRTSINDRKATKPVKTTAPNRPSTPPSSRVKKSQYFPSKKLYGDALKNNRGVKIPSPETKISKNEASPDTSSVSERPRTATLRKGSIVNNNIAGPDVPKTQTAKVQEDYEDDFESYESDFDEYHSSDSVGNLSTSTSESSDGVKSTQRASSAEDEKKLDSGNYELPDARHRQILDNIKESIEKENERLDQNRSNLGSLSDEGFEEGKSLQFINFLGAQRKHQHRKSVELRRKRGEDILSMIRLDHYSYTLLDLPPVPYDIFIKTFGKSNCVQIATQTGHDDINEEIQTEEITIKNRWTQYPPYIDKEHHQCNYLGVGADPPEDHKNDNTFNDRNLEKFIMAAGNLILNLQAEANIHVSIHEAKSNIPFSKACIVYNCQNQDILKSRTIIDVCLSYNNPNKILTAHGTRNDQKSILCLWSLSNVEVPELLMDTFGEVTCCSFSTECTSLVFAGLANGTLAIWDMRESTNCLKNINESLVRSPTYSTEINYGHSCRIVAIQSMSNKSDTLFFGHGHSEVCSLDEDGQIIIWSVIFKETSLGRVVENQGLAHWGSVILAINTHISLSNFYPEIDDFKCTDLTLSHSDSCNLYISTSYGIIVHCLASGGKTSVKKYLPDTQCQANCLEMCPFSQQYFLAGFDNGDICCYSRSIERPLMVLSKKDAAEGKIQVIQWSRNRPLIFYTKDMANTVHIWNLKVSDMVPIYSVPFKDNIICMKLSPVSHNYAVPEQTFMVIATANGSVYVHVLDEEHNQQAPQMFESDKNKFFNYINKYV